MSALAEALVAAQRRAIAAIEKGVVSGTFAADAAMEALDSIGATDKVDQAYLLSALELIQRFGAPLPAENGAPRKPDPATDAQLALVARLVKEQKVTAPDLPLTKVQAHEVIDALKAGTYDPSKWTVPF